MTELAPFLFTVPFPRFIKQMGVCKTKILPVLILKEEYWFPLKHEM